MWTAYCQADGYGTISAYGGSQLAHRVSYALRNGTGCLPPTVCVRHSCANNGCVNPDHLYRCMTVGEAFVGENGPRAKIGEEDVVAVRESCLTGASSIADEAKRLGVEWTTVANAVSGKSWGHVPGSVNGPLGYALGARHYRAKLTNESVRAIRADKAAGATYASLAVKYGVSRSNVILIVKRKSWVHVT